MPVIRIIKFRTFARIFFLGLIGLTLLGAYAIRRIPDSPVSGTAASTQVKPTAAISLAAVTKQTYRVGIQVGHWKNNELPAELAGIYWSTGASAGGYDEWEVNLAIAQAVAALLRAHGITVDLLPATVPVGYQADAFVAIHADGNDDTSVSGYKVAASQWDATGMAQRLSQSIYDQYGTDTGMEPDSVLAISDNMTQYYAFNAAKFQHAIDQTTPGVLVEVGYLSNPADRRFITGSSNLAAQGIADGILDYLQNL